MELGNKSLSWDPKDSIEEKKVTSQYGHYGFGESLVSQESLKNAQENYKAKRD